eukprot:m51a1_g2875 hypothetical protein (139) ;mRNA; f:381816-382643
MSAELLFVSFADSRNVDTAGGDSSAQMTQEGSRGDLSIEVMSRSAAGSDNVVAVARVPLDGAARSFSQWVALEKQGEIHVSVRSTVGLQSAGPSRAQASAAAATPSAAAASRAAGCAPVRPAYGFRPAPASVMSDDRV